MSTCKSIRPGRELRKFAADPLHKNSSKLKNGASYGGGSESIYNFSWNRALGRLSNPERVKFSIKTAIDYDSQNCLRPRDELMKILEGRPWLSLLGDKEKFLVHSTRFQPPSLSNNQKETGGGGGESGTKPRVRLFYITVIEKISGAGSASEERYFGP